MMFTDLRMKSTSFLVNWSEQVAGPTNLYTTASSCTVAAVKPSLSVVIKAIKALQNDQCVDVDIMSTNVIYVS